MLASGGVSPGVGQGRRPGLRLVAPLLAGKYAAVAVTQFGELVQARQAGKQLDYLDFRDWGTPDYAFLDVITQAGFAQRDPATVRAFVAATIAGLGYAAAHPEEAVAIYVKRHPELKAGLLLAQWKAALPSMATGRGAAARQSGRRLLAGARGLDGADGPAHQVRGRRHGRQQRLPAAAVSAAAALTVTGLSVGYAAEPVLAEVGFALAGRGASRRGRPERRRQEHAPARARRPARATWRRGARRRTPGGGG